VLRAWEVNMSVDWFFQGVGSVQLCCGTVRRLLGDWGSGEGNDTAQSFRGEVLWVLEKPSR
jgi:hypothetical protein